MEETTYVQTIQVTWPIWLPLPYTVKNILQNNWTDGLETWYAALGTPVQPKFNPNNNLGFI